MVIKNVAGFTVMMICAVSSRQVQFESLLVQEQIGNIVWRVGMCSPGGILICHLALVAMETDDFFCIMMEPMGYRNGKWVVSDNPSLCV